LLVFHESEHVVELLDFPLFPGQLSVDFVGAMALRVRKGLACLLVSCSYPAP
jgi:hypothetical protein